jgi:hypothetical protein
MGFAAVALLNEAAGDHKYRVGAVALSRAVPNTQSISFDFVNVSAGLAFTVRFTTVTKLSQPIGFSTYPGKHP